MCFYMFSFVCFTDRVTEVKTDIYVTSFGPVSDTDMVSLISFNLHFQFLSSVFVLQDPTC